MTQYRTVTTKWWKKEADRLVTVSIVLLHIVALGALLPTFFSWSGVLLLVILYWISGGLGITLCYHRLLTHKSFQTPNWVRNILTSFGCLAMQGSPEDWVGTHWYHHKHSDKEDDPHSPKHGFAWSHILWVLTKSPDGFCARNYAKYLGKEPFMVFLRKYWWLPQVILTLILYTLGFLFGGHMLAISWIIWGVALRTVLVFHFTWFVNSATHKWGYKNFHETGDNSRNLWWVAWLAFGEGWHNNHHGEPSSAAHGMKKWEFDPTYRTIKLMERFGLASKVIGPSKIQN